MTNTNEGPTITGIAEGLIAGVAPTVPELTMAFDKGGWTMSHTTARRIQAALTYVVEKVKQRGAFLCDALLEIARESERHNLPGTANALGILRDAVTDLNK